MYVLISIFFAISFSPESQENAQLFGRLIQEIHHEFGGAENCPWSPAVLKEAFRRYHVSCKAKQKRVASGQDENHIIVLAEGEAERTR
ncbi:Hypothetical predicted protein [Paramuricea clavata]|uniref:Uncharacterized protein n=1 Tax=Paramuricea clavata TaxID=317549 RepID=A0A7D9IDH1_PARCT|nr:Hypothetical predicted protein [Paramuricea clavata]